MSGPRINRVVADFKAEATGEQTIRLKDLRGKKVVLYFYPKDSTPGCTTEGQDFRDLHAKFKRANAVILGVSRDSLASHEKFKAKHEFPFELLSDPDPFLLFRMTDAEIMQHLRHAGPYQNEIVTRLKYRRLFKQAYNLQLSEATEQEQKLIHHLESPQHRHEKELELADELNIPKGHIIIDVPRPELLRAEPRINQTGIIVMDHHTPKSLDIYTPIAQAVRERMTPDWSLMIITDDKYRDVVAKKAPQIVSLPLDLSIARKEEAVR